MKASKPKAFTLIELIITMTMGSALMFMAVGLIHQAMSLGTLAREHGNQARTRSQLTAEFRRDVHLAVSCEVNQNRLMLKMADDQTVGYWFDSSQVQREETLADQQLRHETYSFSGSTEVAFDVREEPQRAVLTILRQLPTKPASTRVECEVAAVIGFRSQSHLGETP